MLGDQEELQLGATDLDKIEYDVTLSRREMYWASVNAFVLYRWVWVLLLTIGGVIVCASVVRHVYPDNGIRGVCDLIVLIGVCLIVSRLALKFGRLELQYRTLRKDMPRKCKLDAHGITGVREKSTERIEWDQCTEIRDTRYFIFVVRKPHRAPLYIRKSKLPPETLNAIQDLFSKLSIPKTNPPQSTRLTKNWLRRNWIVMSVIGCLLLAAVLCGAGIRGTIALGGYLMKRSDACQLAAQEIRASAAVIQKLGDPIEERWYATGNITTTSDGGGTASLSF